MNLRDIRVFAKVRAAAAQTMEAAQTRATASAAMALAVALLVVSVSCVKNEPVGGSAGAPREISYLLTPVKTGTKAGTKAETKTGTKAATFSQFPESETFGTCAWYLPEGKTWSLNHDEAQLYIADERISLRNGVWKAWGSGKSYWWPVSGSLTFLCWAPAELKGLSAGAEDGLRIDGWTMTGTAGFGGDTDFDGSVPEDGSTDILVATSADLKGNTPNGWTGSNGAVFGEYGAKIEFRHALCKVRFLISLAPDEDEETLWYVEKATVQDICTSGDFVGDGWTNQGERKSYSFSLITDEKPAGQKISKKDTLLFPMTMMMPQKLTRPEGYIPRIDIVAWDGKSWTKDSEGNRIKDRSNLTGFLYSNETEASEWKPGTRITYRLYLTSASGSYIEFDASVSDWGGTAGGDIELK